MNQNYSVQVQGITAVLDEIWRNIGFNIWNIAAGRIMTVTCKDVYDMDKYLGCR